MDKYYVYLHFRKDTGEVFYVGKGSGNRHLIKSNRSLHWKRVVDKYGYYSTILHDNLSEEESFKTEIYYIDLYKGQLVNKTLGGEGSSGRKWSPSEKVRQNMSKGQKGKVLSEEHKRKTSQSLKGRMPKNIDVIRNTPTPVNVYDLDCNYITTFNSLKECANALGLLYQNISDCCRGGRKRVKKYKFKYV